MPEAHVNGIRLFYEEHGGGAPIMCIHGGGSSAVMWEDAFEDLSQLGQVIAYDRRGCTRSERPEPYATSVAEQAGDAAGLLDALGVDAPAILIARSYGGAVAIELALTHPQRVRALALLEGDALGLSPDALRWTVAMRDRLRTVATEQGMDAVYETLVGEVFGAGAWESFPAEVRELLTDNGPALLAEVEYVDEPMPGPEAFARITQPVLLVAASDSPRELRAMTEAMAEVLPNAKMAVVGGGHMINPAAPEVLAFVELVVRGD